MSEKGGTENVGSVGKHRGWMKKKKKKKKEGRAHLINAEQDEEGEASNFFDLELQRKHLVVRGFVVSGSLVGTFHGNRKDKV